MRTVLLVLPVLNIVGALGVLACMRWVIGYDRFGVGVAIYNLAVGSFGLAWALIR